MRVARVIMFGSEGSFSRPVLAELLAHGVSVVAIVSPGITAHRPPGPEFPMPVEQVADPSSLEGLAKANEIPVLRSQNLGDAQFVTYLSSLKADVLLVACFPLKLPGSLQILPRIGCWNLHPSLLPKYRGPVPLFWQLRMEEEHTGITLHEVTEQMDSGNIVAQLALPLPADRDTMTLDNWVAKHGVALFLGALNDWREGCLASRPQDEAAASYFPYPDR